eukprot:g3620.t1
MFAKCLSRFSEADDRKSLQHVLIDLQTCVQHASVAEWSQFHMTALQKKRQRDGKLWTPGIHEVYRSICALKRRLAMRHLSSNSSKGNKTPAAVDSEEQSLPVVVDVEIPSVTFKVDTVNDRGEYETTATTKKNANEVDALTSDRKKKATAGKRKKKRYAVYVIKVKLRYPSSANFDSGGDLSKASANEIDCIIGDESNLLDQYVVERRFSDFYAFDQKLRKKYPEFEFSDMVVQLPRRITGQILPKFSTRLLTIRRDALKGYLASLCDIHVHGAQLRELQAFLGVIDHAASIGSREARRRGSTLGGHISHGIRADSNVGAESLLTDTRLLDEIERNVGEDASNRTNAYRERWDRIVRISEGERFEAALQSVLHNAVGSESQQLRDYVRKFKVAFESFGESSEREESRPSKLLAHARNFVTTLAESVLKRSFDNLRRSAEADAHIQSRRRSAVSTTTTTTPDVKGTIDDDELRAAVHRYVEAAIVREIGACAETVVMWSTAEKDMTTLDLVGRLQSGGLPLPMESESFGVPAAFQSPEWYAAAIQILNAVDKAPLPTDKLHIFICFVHALQREALSANKSAKYCTADDLVPLMVYAVASSSLNGPHTALATIRSLASERFLRGEPSYYLTVFESVLFFLSSGGATSLDDGGSGREGGLLLRVSGSSGRSRRSRGRKSSTKKAAESSALIRHALTLGIRRSILVQENAGLLSKNPLKIWVPQMFLTFDPRTRKLKMSFQVASILAPQREGGEKKKILAGGSDDETPKIYFVRRSHADLVELNKALLVHRAMCASRMKAAAAIVTTGRDAENSTSRLRTFSTSSLPRVPENSTMNRAPRELDWRLDEANATEKKPIRRGSIADKLKRMLLKRSGTRTGAKLTTPQIEAIHRNEIEVYLTRLAVIFGDVVSTPLFPTAFQAFLGLPKGAL